ncbi:Cytochrome P450 [Nakamurella panacisegetis]|uniref:Cytochrome P450 n=1 Tax=Nakamurella panacisegetis TaxID=1090615 RepID=A0A1H0KRV3_9ACTN|nr:cytochrome P450 [Nakamurella panacisegetis]SDO58595.1 Cytochrome P450 [Nakamurella panacisegetis]
MTEAFMPLMRNGLDPVPWLAQRQLEQPVSRLEFPFGISAYLVTGYDDVRSVIGDTKSFSNDFSNVVASTAGQATAAQDPGGLGFSDPPQHTKLRKALTPEFTVRRLARLVPRIEQIVAQQLDVMEARRATGSVDLVETFAMPIPSLVICELLDVPYPDRADFQRLSGSRFDIFGGAGTGLDAISESLTFMRELVAAQRQVPGDGLLGMLIREHGDELSDAELAGLADGLLVGGHETTASMLALGVVLLLQHPDVAAALRADDEATGPTVEEMLRYLTVVQLAFPRFAKQDMELGGQSIKAGEMVLCSLSGANRDPALGENLQSFDPRHLSPHLAFGYGAHRCVGAELARMELRIAYPALLRRFPGLRLATEPDQITFHEYSVVHGVDDLPVTW